MFPPHEYTNNLLPMIFIGLCVAIDPTVAVTDDYTLSLALCALADMRTDFIDTIIRIIIFSLVSTNKRKRPDDEATTFPSEFRNAGHCFRYLRSVI